MVIISKSKSHPDLLFYGRGGKLTAANECDSSVSSLEVVTDDKSSTLKTPTEGDKAVIGSLLWKLLTSGKLPLNNSTSINIDWREIQQKHPSLSTSSTQDLQAYHSALTSIIILDESLDERAAPFLKQYKGHLMDLTAEVTSSLEQQAPPSFTAFVADFNDNLAYAMKPTRGIPVPQSAASLLQEEFQTLLNSSRVDIQASFLKTEYKTIPQPAHVDFPWQVLKKQAQQLWLGFFGLTQEGMILQVWPSAEHCQGQLVFVPLGKLLILPSDTIHGGGFRTRPIHEPQNVGNLRYHLYLALEGGELPRFANNTYTLPHDKRYELAEVCANAPHCESDGSGLLMDLLLD